MGVLREEVEVLIIRSLLHKEVDVASQSTTPPTHMVSGHVHSAPDHNSQQQATFQTRNNGARARSYYSMSDPSITVAEAFKQFSQVTVSAVGPGYHLPPFSSSFIQPPPPPPPFTIFQLRAYEHGTRARLTQTEDDLRVLRHERDDSIRDLNACREQSRVWVAEVNRWKAEARLSPLLLPFYNTHPNVYL
jgi:hypothetical protein